MSTNSTTGKATKNRTTALRIHADMALVAYSTTHTLSPWAFRISSSATCTCCWRISLRPKNDARPTTIRGNLALPLGRQRQLLPRAQVVLDRPHALDSFGGHVDGMPFTLGSHQAPQVDDPLIDDDGQ